MAFTTEQIAEIKKQLIDQINSSFPDDKKAESISKIEAMNDSEVIEFLEQNNLIRDESGNPVESGNCIFCSIISDQTPSVKISEDENSIAILELNPLSEGHTIVMPKNHQNEIPKETEDLAQKIKSTLENTLKPKNVLIENGSLFGHAIINVIPIYGDSVETQRKQSTPEELEKIKEKIFSSVPQEKPENKKETSSESLPKIEKINSENITMPRRIP